MDIKPIQDIQNLKEFIETLSEIFGYEIESDSISYNWTTGGYTGGSCWGGEHYPRTVEDEPEDGQLEKILNNVYPQLTFLQFKRLEKEGLWTVQEKNQREYYGNNTETTTKTLNLDVLFERLKEMSDK